MLAARDFDVDIGVVEYNRRDCAGKKVRMQLEIDFVANKGSSRYYIQSAFSIGDEEKREQEIRPLKKVSDSFRKIVILRDDIVPWQDENGILYLGIEEFLLDENAVNAV